MLRPIGKGATIGIVAPAAPVLNRSDVLRGIEFWREHGVKTKLACKLFERHGYHTGPAEARAAALNAFFAAPDVDAIQVVWGGFGSTELIPHLDWDLIRANPKPLVGRSDVTALHLAFARFAGYSTFYGPGLVNAAPAEPSAFTQSGLVAALTRVEPLGTLPRHPKDGFTRMLSPGRAAGRLAGGCLWPLCKAIGTPWQADLEGKIFFFEEIGEPPWSIDAHLTHLKQSGVLDGIVGVVIGRMVDCEWSPARAVMPADVPLEDVLEAHFGGLDIPVLYGLPIGHEPDTLTIPLGVQAVLEGGNLHLTQSPFGEH
jgi:muramoyltetrapeptide carboxypeptidase